MRMISDDKTTERRTELEYQRSELKMYNRWWDEKNRFDYWENMTFEQIESKIEKTKERIEKLESALAG